MQKNQCCIKLDGGGLMYDAVQGIDVWRALEAFLRGLLHPSDLRHIESKMLLSPYMKIRVKATAIILGVHVS